MNLRMLGAIIPEKHPVIPGVILQNTLVLIYGQDENQDIKSHGHLFHLIK